MGEVVPGRRGCRFVPHQPYIPNTLPLCCNYPVQKCHSASVVLTSTLRVNKREGEGAREREPGRGRENKIVTSFEAVLLFTQDAEVITVK